MNWTSVLAIMSCMWMMCGQGSFMVFAGDTGWQSHTVRQLDYATGPTRKLPAQFQVVTRNWDRAVSNPNAIGQPYLVYMPERDRLLMAANPQTMLIFSDDHGATWTDPRPAHADAQGSPDVGGVRALSYLGNGKLILGSHSSRWFSDDYGQTWKRLGLVESASNGYGWNQWNPYLVDVDPNTTNVVRIAETGWNRRGGSGPHTLPFIRFSYDQGMTWKDEIQVPQWDRFNEVALCRAANGNIVAGCRSHMPNWYAGRSDYFSGFGVSVSGDNGATWSKVSMLYTYGRHHPSTVVMDKGEMVMTYVVRLGYPGNSEDFPQRGIEAVVSRDHGLTWDVGHVYVLSQWSGAEFLDAPQSTSTVRFPDGSIITAYGAGYPTKQWNGEPYPKGTPTPHAIGLIKWRLSDREP